MTPEDLFMNRRGFLKAAGLGTVAMAAGSLAACRGGGLIDSLAGGDPLANIQAGSPNLDLYPASRNPSYRGGRPITPERIAATTNNFYEFSLDKGRVWRLSEKLVTRPWTIEIGGLAKRPAVYDVDQLVRRLGLEERIYRLRCVEAWSMVVPWTGFPLARLVELAEPSAEARFIRMESFHDPSVAPGQKKWVMGQPLPPLQGRDMPWPYYEGLSLEEAVHPLAFMATGIYGHELPKQHGAPIRLVVPWKYGFKSIKSVVRIEFLRSRPRSFWNDLAPEEYGFWANVRPDIPHPRWSQAWETDIGTRDRMPTSPYNGYASEIAGLYGGHDEQG